MVNLRWLAAGNLAVKPLWFLFLLFSTRMLGPAEFGRFMVAISYVGIIWSLFEGGIDMYTMRELSVNPDRFKQLFSHTTSLKAGLGLLMAVAVILSAGAGAVPSSMLVLASMATLYAILNAVMIHMRYVFRAFEIMKYEALSIMLEKGLVVVICSASLFIATSAEAFMAGYLVAYLLAAAATLVIVVRGTGALRFTIDGKRLWSDVGKPALPFALMGIFTVLYYRSGTLMLQWLTGDEILVGYYNAGFRLVESFALLPSIVVMPLYATFARRAGGQQELFRLIEKSMRALLAASLIVSIPLMLFREEFTLLLFGESFRPAAASLGILVLTMVPVGMGWLFTYLASALDRQRTMNFYLIGTTLANLVLNALLIPRFGVYGAAVTTLLTESAVTLCALLVVRDYLVFRPMLRIAAGAAVGSIVVAGAGWLGLYRGSFVVQVGLACGLLIALFSVLGVLRLSDLKAFLEA